MKLEPKMKLLKHKRTKIIATIGPACADEDSIRQMIQKGVNIFRLNMSHGEHAEHYASCQMIRNIAAECEKHIAVLVDLCGPKIRTGTFKNNQIVLVKGDGVTITMRDVEGEPSLIPSQYKGLARDVTVGQRIFLADGVMELVVEKVERTEVYCRVLQGGMLGNHKGINLPDSVVSAPSMSEKDYDDAMFAVGLGVDFLALSFVRHVDHIHLLRAWLEQQGSDIHIIAKIERPEALEDACAIIEAADAIMVARGDLGVELPPEQVPITQDMLIKEARKQCKPVIVATQVLESMIEHARPTRAEATDIFHSVSSSADAIMLSGETAVGQYPIQAVAMMARVIINAEAYLWHQGAFCSAAAKAQSHQSVLPFGRAVARSTSLLSRDLMVHGIVVLSESGWTTVTVSSERPEAPILAVTSSEETCRWMSLIWGVIPVLVEAKDMGNHVALAKSLAQTYRLAKVGDPILLVQGFHRDEANNCPSIMVLKV